MHTTSMRHTKLLRGCAKLSSMISSIVTVTKNIWSAYGISFNGSENDKSVTLTVFSHVIGGRL